MVYDVAMQRTQLLLEKWQHQRLKAMAERQGRSFSQLVREILTQHLQPRAPDRRRGLAAIEAAGDDPEATGREHDRFLYGDPPRR